MVRGRLLELLLILLVQGGEPQDISPWVDSKTLSELPLEKLLKVKKTFKCEQCGETGDLEGAQRRSDDEPEALALQSKQHLSRGGYGGGGGGEEHSKKGGKKSVQSIFQISVTTLAFLAFGGYLLCLVVQAIKGKEMSMENNMMSMTEMLQIIKRRPGNRRTTRRPMRNKRPVRRPNIRHKREVWPDVDPERMYQALILLSEGYTHYHTINFDRYNYSSSYLL